MAPRPDRRHRATGMYEWASQQILARPQSALASLLGVPRAALLRALERPATVGELAARLHLVPSGITHHIQVLEPAGLVRRERRGQFVLVHRTARGTELLELFARSQSSTSTSPV